jgi:acyl-CoA reductase-like NAD-dependent aldehyde dehydrogenase
MSTAPDMKAFAGAERHLMLIGGERVDSAAGTIDIVDPATEAVIGSTPAADAADVDRAVQVAHDNFYGGPWPGFSAKDRARILWRMADLMEENAEELARLEAGNGGMLLQLARYMVAYSADLFRYYAGWTTKIDGKTAHLSGNGRSVHAFTLKAPIGVCAFIVPWNAPISLTSLKLAPALAAGCTCVVKPAEETPLTALRLAQLLRQAGLPDGVVNVVTGYGHIAGAALAAHDKVRKIAFTGSTEVGKRIAVAATGNLKKVTLELGGKSPTIIFDDADIEQAIAGAAAAIFTNSGQICFAGSRLYVQRKSFDRVVAGVAAHARKLKVGDPMADGIDLGPIISARQIGHVMGLIDSGAKDGAELVTGGRRLDRPGYFVEPTLFINPRADARIVKEEIFGPVLTAMPFDDVEEVMQMANDTVYGLAASVWTRDIGKANLVAQRCESGCVWINCAFLNDPSMPGGGYKQSGWGREGGKEGLDAYLETKKVFTLLN